MRDVGVVDPIRVPGWARELYRQTPVVARVFIGLAALDVVLRLVGLFEPTIDLTRTDPLSIVTNVVPRDLWILLPALIVIRRPDASIATPLILAGVIVLAVTELLQVQVEAWLGARNGLSAGATGIWAGTAALIAVTAGRVALARGLARLTPHQPTDAVAGIANLVAFGVLLGVVAELASFAADGYPTFGVPALDQADIVRSGAGIVSTIALAVLLRAVVRGIGDARRTGLPVILGGVAAALVGVMSAVVAVGALLGLVLAPAQAFDSSIASVDSWTEFVVGPALLVVAFALGLADPPFPYVMARAEDPSPSADDARANEPQASEPSGDTSAA